MPTDRELSAELQRLRLELGWTRNRLATRLQCDEKTIRNYEAVADRSVRTEDATPPPPGLVSALREYLAYQRAAPKLPALGDLVQRGYWSQRARLEENGA